MQSKMPTDILDYTMMEFTSDINQIEEESSKTIEIDEKIEIDARSVFVGNVDYRSDARTLEGHFRECGTVERVTIPADRFTGNPKGFAYIEFAEIKGKQNALALNDSLFLGRQIKVTDKRTNKPGISTTNRPPRRCIRRFGPGFRGRRGLKHKPY